MNKKRKTAIVAAKKRMSVACRVCGRPAAFRCRHGTAGEPEPFCSLACCDARCLLLCAAPTGPKIKMRRGEIAETPSDETPRERRAADLAWLDRFLSGEGGAACGGSSGVDLSSYEVYRRLYTDLARDVDGDDAFFQDALRTYATRDLARMGRRAPFVVSGEISVSLSRPELHERRLRSPTWTAAPAVDSTGPWFGEVLQRFDASGGRRRAPDVVVRFVILELGEERHSNVVVINRLRSEIYYFEPHGSIASWNEAAEASVRAYLLPLLPGYSFQRTLDFCPRASWQSYDPSPVGICMLLSTAFALLRMRLATLTSKEIVDRVQSALEADAKRVVGNVACAILRIARDPREIAEAVDAARRAAGSAESIVRAAAAQALPFVAEGDIDKMPLSEQREHVRAALEGLSEDDMTPEQKSFLALELREKRAQVARN